MGKHLVKLVQLLKVLPISSAACERGFNQMNLHHTSERNRLLVERVSDLMMLSINRPPLSLWNARKYVLSWLKSGKHGALDKVTGLFKVKVDFNRSTNLFVRVSMTAVHLRCNLWITCVNNILTFMTVSFKIEYWRISVIMKCYCLLSRIQNFLGDNVALVAYSAFKF